MWSSLLNKPQQGAYFWLDCSHLQNVPVEYDKEMERKRTHSLLLPKDEQSCLDTAKESNQTHSPHECVGEQNQMISAVPRARDCKFQEMIK